MSFGFGPGSWLSSQSTSDSAQGGYKLTESDDIAVPPPPPTGQAGNASEWANPYTSSPPLVAVPVDSGPSWDTWFQRGKQITTGLVDIYGRAVNPQGTPIAQPLPSSGLPLWGIVALGVGGVVVLGLAARSMRSRSYAGYRRRRSRR